MAFNQRAPLKNLYTCIQISNNFDGFKKIIILIKNI